MPNLSLNNLQTELIHASANNVQPSWRERFLAAVTDNLEGVGSISPMRMYAEPFLTLAC
jgi:hypothetical protein